MKTCFALLLAALSALTLNAQVWNDLIDDDLIKTVQFYPQGAPTVMPITSLSAGANALILEFDRVDTEIKDYLYTIQHCNADWTPSDLEDVMYINGYTEDRITQADISINTLTQYVHYSLGLPNANMKWRVSGNYILKIFDEDDDRRLVLARRFMVTESTTWKIEPTFVRPYQTAWFDSHHELDFTVKAKGARFTAPAQEVRAVVLQNTAWSTALGPLPPLTLRGEDLLYDYIDKIVFPGSSEWRVLDMRTFDFKGEGIRMIRQQYNGMEVTMKTDESRNGGSYIQRPDANGRFVIENRNQNQGLLQCDYANVLFSIARNQEEEGKSVYLYGQLTDFQIKPEFRFTYLNEAKAYVLETPLKQGYYNYQFVVIDDATGLPDLEDGFEGNHFQTVNAYTILVYFRKIGERYERLMGTLTVESKI